MAKKQKGLYIVFEGMVGSGKTTQSKLVYSWLAKKYPKRKVIYTREPGGSEIADEIRRVVQGMEFKEEMDPVCEQYLYAASRAQTLRKIVKPVLDDGGIVVADRSFFTSITNQGFGRGMGIKKVLKINEAAVEKLWPKRVYYIAVPVELGLARVKDGKGDKFESYGKEFYTKIVKGYEYMVKNMKMVVKIDGVGSVEEINKRVIKEVKKIV